MQEIFIGTEQNLVLVKSCTSVGNQSIVKETYEELFIYAPQWTQCCPVVLGQLLSCHLTS